MPGMGVQAVQHALHREAARGEEQPAFPAALFQHALGGDAAEGKTQKNGVFAGEQREPFAPGEGRGLMRGQRPGPVCPGKVQAARQRRQKAPLTRRGGKGTDVAGGERFALQLTDAQKPREKISRSFQIP